MVWYCGLPKGGIEGQGVFVPAMARPMCGAMPRQNAPMARAALLRIARKRSFAWEERCREFRRMWLARGRRKRRKMNWMLEVSEKRNPACEDGEFWGTVRWTLCYLRRAAHLGVVPLVSFCYVL